MRKVARHHLFVNSSGLEQLPQANFQCVISRHNDPFALCPLYKLTDSFEEGSHLEEYTYKNTGGSGKYEGAGGGGTYTLDELTDTLLGGRYKGTIELR